MCRVPSAGKSSRVVGRVPCARDCNARSVAHRLRRIGDELQTRRTSGSKSAHPRPEEPRVTAIHLLCAAIRLTMLALCVRKRHL